MSTHRIHPHGLAALRRWGSEHYAPRRRVLDKLLVDAAVATGVELREQTAVKGLLWEDGRVSGVRCSRGGTREVEPRARIVLGADCLWSTVAEQVGARTYHDKVNLTCAYNSYCRGIDQPRLTLYPRPGCVIGEIPTQDGLTCFYGTWSVSEFHSVRTDIARRVAATIEALAGGQGEAERFVGAVTGTVPVAEFFAPENLARIIGGLSDSRAATTEVEVA
jgi:hypothetical protein